MKMIAIIIPIMAIALTVNAAPFLSDEETTTGGQASVVEQKDECLLVALNCPDNVDTLQQRIDKLQAEINKGTAVYTEEELNILNGKLIDARDTERDLVEKY